jgi:hypothetical protein
MRTGSASRLFSLVDAEEDQVCTCWVNSCGEEEWVLLGGWLEGMKSSWNNSLKSI